MFCAIVIIVNVKVLINSFQYTFWSVLLVAISIVSFFAVFALFSSFEFMTTYGELSHTYNRTQIYITLLFFTSGYILIDSGL
jgi:hypothetical protein